MVNLRWRPAGLITGRGRTRPDSQRGLAVLTLAIIGLVFTSLMTAPVLGRLALNLRSQNVQTLAAVTGSGAASGAEHALWRIEHDQAFLDSMTGSPPSATYVLDLPSGPTTITVTAASTPPSSPLSAALTVSPVIVPPDQPSTLTYTMTVTNDDSVPHEITRVDTTPFLWNPAYVAGSTSGFTTADPSISAFDWRWDVVPPVTVPPLGGQITMSYSVVGNEPAGTWWTLGSVTVSGIGAVQAPMTARVRFTNLGALDITTSVTPADVPAGSNQTFLYAIDVTNSGSTPFTLNWIAHNTTGDFTYVPGSSGGASIADPAISWNFFTQRYKHRWTFPPTPIPAQSSLQLTFQMTASLPPGVHTSQSSLQVAEDLGWLQRIFDLSSIDTGETAPITARRAYSIVSSQGTGFVNVEALLSDSGVSVLSWLEGNSG